VSTLYPGLSLRFEQQTCGKVSIVGNFQGIENSIMLLVDKEELSLIRREMRCWMENAISKYHLSPLADGGWPRDTTPACDFLQALEIEGAKILLKLMPPSDAQILRSWVNNGVKLWDAIRPKPPSIIFEADSDKFFPIEWLPLCQRLQSSSALSAAASVFPAFRVGVQRVFFGFQRSIGTTALQNDPVLNIKWFHHNDPKLTSTYEVRMFLDQFSSTKLSPPFPICKQIRKSDAPKRVKKRINDPRFHIIHFACHGFTLEDIPTGLTTETGEPTLSLCHLGDDSGRHLLKLSDLRHELNLLYDAPPSKQEYVLPMIFINACGSNHLASVGGDSFPYLFCQNGNPTVIGTESSVFDAHALEMARLFYHHFQAGRQAIHSLHLAKLALLTKHANPLGLCYSLYGCADTRVVRPVHWQYLKESCFAH
jgi:CHAT domain